MPLGSDMGPPMVDDLERRTSALPDKLLADGGYASRDWRPFPVGRRGGPRPASPRCARQFDSSLSAC
jgi:hypothetical protein